MQKRTPATNEQGFVSILVCVTIMVILSLVTIGFARVMQREARQALDRQLSTQAFYAAESGVNDAIAIARQNPDVAKTDCGNPPSGPYSALDPDLDNTNNVAYTCLLVNPAPGNLIFDEISVDRSTVTKMQPQGGVTSNRLVVSWQSADSTNLDSFRPGGNMDFPPATGGGAWGAATTGILRLSLFPVPLNGSTPAPGDRDSLAAAARTYFLYPQVEPGEPNPAGTPDNIQYNGLGDENGIIMSGNCNRNRTPRRCSVEIHLNSISNNYAYFARLKSIYNPVSVELAAFNGSNPVALTGSQIMIDATGKTNDVFRRIQVRVPTERYYDLPEFAIETADDLCKRITVAPNFMADECDPSGGGGGGGGIINPAPPPPANPPPPPPPPPPAAPPCFAGTVEVMNSTTEYHFVYPFFTNKDYPSIGTFTPAIAACRYRINIRTQDTGHPQDSFLPPQDDERLFIEGYAADGTLQFTTGLTDDIPDSATGVTTYVGTFTLSRPVVRVTIRHISEWPTDPERSLGQASFNSLDPDTIEFVPVP